MQENELGPDQRRKLQMIILQLKNLNATIRRLDACQNLTPADKFSRSACEMEKIKLIAEVYTLLGNCKHIPLEVEEVLR
ncbi:GfV-B20-ORF1 [Ichnoviriform fumiferanae]|uniref:GfV-B20-ORF1 n=1 Tax=Ichnoviriform fumiferanae TaxID=419435 RepID=A2PZR8_9VIRU|nr:GfV-B20-ORF1 [Ichnoviriform fumiferanae]BAF45490.1 GfV-B20-ORF1 [Ichnoviriform fumiferanae]